MVRTQEATMQNYGISAFSKTSFLIHESAARVQGAWYRQTDITFSRQNSPDQKSTAS